MDKKEYQESRVSQEEINYVWQKTWEKDSYNLSVVKNRFFIEAYPVFKKYIPNTAGRILELGTGTGRFGVSIAKDFKASRVFATDILEGSVNLARNLAKDLNIQNIEFSIQDCFKIKFEDNFFDVVLADGVIQLFINYEEAVMEMIRVLKPGGLLIIAVPNFWNFHTAYKFLRRMIGKKFEYDYEKSFKKHELREALIKEKIKIIAEDGFYVGYGIFRLKKYHRIFHLLGRIINRISKIFDRFTNRFFTRNFGFEIVIVGQK